MPRDFPSPSNTPSCRLIRARRATATVELAICLPLLVLIVFGAAEGAGMIFLKQALVQSAYEGAKVAIERDSTNADVQTATERVLSGRTLNNTTLELNPRNIENAPRGTVVSVSIRAPSSANSIFPFGIFEGREIEGRAVMVKE